MSQENIIRAWKDADFRNSLSRDAKTVLPDNPAGLIQLNDTELGAISGGQMPDVPWCPIEWRIMSKCTCQLK
ncbi:mersacidin/lichenicidin family type 2 lantibiotic [Alkalinema sp. FACHB-956]|uniref:mersacidin/lichenicidin family type 2 lantibiotic n=1 Tax=Alkalinema sp. FACHB-956 TaxID=2692768 RepID=UPI0016878F6C|nr:mersacidin/lichenicidin family type 2 lantibiotic [Alkalinema sp. FACHB-956]MBD2328722.1 mersacidin/lichenicidin family type 2 lantibiotic [Alkalinema sp. FACHB-956]